MAEPIRLVRVPTLKTVAEFRQHIASLGIELPCEDEIVAGPSSPLAQPIARVTINGKRIGNRWAIQPMEGWDGTTNGGATEEVRRRWQRFGESGVRRNETGARWALADGRGHVSLFPSKKPGVTGEKLACAGGGVN